MGPLLRSEMLPPETNDDHEARWISVPKELIGDVVELVSNHRKQKRKITETGRKLRAYRVKHDLLLKNMADEIGVSSWSMCSYERGDPIPCELVSKIDEGVHRLYIK